MNIRIRTPQDHSADSFTRKDFVADKPHEVRPERMRGRRYRNDSRSHDAAWPERRAEKMTQFASRVIKFLEPIGYVGPMADAIDLRELTATQCIVHKREHQMGVDCIAADLAPEWLRLQANSVDCVSMYSTYTDADGEEQEVTILIADEDGVIDDEASRQASVTAVTRLASEAIAQQLDANIESFVRQNDRAFWYTDRPKVAVEVADTNGKRSIAPKPNHPWTVEQLRAIAKRVHKSAEEILATRQRSADPQWHKQRALQGVRALLTPQELQWARLWERDRRWLEGRGDIADTTSDAYDAAQERYVNTVECPNCIDGTIEDPETGIDENCPVCQGSASVLQTLGFEGIPVAEPVEKEPPEHDGPSTAFIDYVTSQLTP